MYWSALLVQILASTKLLYLIGFTNLPRLYRIFMFDSIIRGKSSETHSYTQIANKLYCSTWNKIQTVHDNLGTGLQIHHLQNILLCKLDSLLFTKSWKIYEHVFTCCLEVLPRNVHYPYYPFISLYRSLRPMWWATCFWAIIRHLLTVFLELKCH